MKNLIKTVATAAALALAPLLAGAGQPIAYEATITNSIPAGTGATVPLTYNVTGNTWTNFGNGSVHQTNALDTLQSQTISLTLSAVGTLQGAGAYTAATNTVNTIVSPDGLNWMPGPSVSMILANSNSWQGSYSNIDARGFRYIALTNITSWMTNAAISNANLHVGVFLKGP